MLNVRADFPYLERLVNGQPIIYLDSAATTQKPRHVIGRVVDLYSSGLANVHRAVNFLAEEVTQAFEGAREVVARFLGADAQEIIFLSNATQAINVVCSSLACDGPIRVLTTSLEHHSNLLPWTARGSLDLVPWDRIGRIDLDALKRQLSKKPDLVTVARASNFLGTLQPVQEIITACHEAGVAVLLDATQSIAHVPHDVRDLGCDYLVFSGHKIYGPGGSGVLYATNRIMERMHPVFFGGDMVKEVHLGKYELNDLPHRFEAGTPNIEGAIGLAAALQYVEKLSYDAIREHESALVQHAKRRVAELEGARPYGPPAGEPCVPLVAFEIKGLEAGAVAKILAARANVIVRSGFHCAQPAHDELGAGPTVRASFAVYSTREEIDRMVEVLQSLTSLVAR